MPKGTQRLSGIAWPTMSEQLKLELNKRELVSPALLIVRL